MDKEQQTNKSDLSCCQKLCDLAPFRFFKKIFSRKKEPIKEEKEIRDNLSEKKVDKMVKDSFPASDPPSTY